MIAVAVGITALRGADYTLDANLASVRADADISLSRTIVRSRWVLLGRSGMIFDSVQ